MIISVLRQGRFHKNKASVTPSDCFIFKGHESFEEMDNPFAPFPSLEKPVSVPRASIFLESFAFLGFFTVSFLVPKYSENDL